jgi:hypothetical protein
MLCSSCDSPVPEGARFCANCGAPVQQTSAVGQGTGPVAGSSPPPAAPPGGTSRAKYIPPTEPSLPPPKGPDRLALWVGIGLAVLVLVAAAVAIPLILTADSSGSADATTTSSSAQVSETTTSLPTATTVLAGPIGDSAGSWVEVPVSGGPWAANDVAVSEDALLIQSTTATGFKLSAIMFGTGDVVTLSEAEALWGIDIDGGIAVWWEGSDWDAAAEQYGEQHIYTYRLPDGPKTIVAEGTGGTMMLPQIALPWVSWVVAAPWADNPTEYWSERIMYARVDDSGAPVGAAGVLVPSALAFALGDSTWQYSLSSARVAWEHGTTGEGYDVGTHLMGMDLSGHALVGADAWRPSLYSDILVYWDGSLKVSDLAGGGTHDLDPSGDFATAGPTFAAYYRPGGAGSLVVVSGYGGAHEQVLGELAMPPYWCPPISVSARHVAYAADTVAHLFEWQTP